MHPAAKARQQSEGAVDTCSLPWSNSRDGDRRGLLSKARAGLSLARLLHSERR